MSKMDLVSRRSFMKLCAMTAAYFTSHGLASRALARPQGRRPRYYVILLMFGGVDAIFSTDPKRRSEVDKIVDVPFGAKDIVHANGVRLGPHFAPLKSHLSRVAFVNGVRVAAANHVTGSVIHSRMLRNAAERMPAILDVLGIHRNGQPLSTITLGSYYSPQQYSDRYFGSPTIGQDSRGITLLEHVDQLTPEEQVVIAKKLDKEAQRARKRGDRATGDSLLEASRFFAQLPQRPQFKREDWFGKEVGKWALESQEYLQRGLWAIENDLTQSVYLTVGGSGAWDSHVNNNVVQAKVSEVFTTLFRRFLDELQRRKNRFGSLAEQTVIIGASEIGRSPALNRELGKDHFPQAPFLFSGPWFKSHDGSGGPFGATGREMESIPVSLTTGKPQRDGHLLTIDDVGTTLLNVAGLPADVFGYSGRNLDFILNG